MNITKNRNGKELTVTLAGRLDTLTAPELAKQLEGEPEGTDRIIFELRDLKFISSAGIRVLLLTVQNMGEPGRVVLRNVSTPIRSVLNILGLLDSFVVE